MQVERHHAVGAGAGDQVGDQLGRDRRARAGFAVLPGVAEIGHHRGDAARRRAAQRVDDDQQLHQMVVGRERRRLEHENVGAADVLLDLDEDLHVGEAPHHGLGQRGLEIGGDRLGELRVGVAGDELDRSVLRRHGRLLKPYPLRNGRGDTKAPRGLAIRPVSLSRSFFRRWSVAASGERRRSSGCGRRVPGACLAACGTSAAAGASVVAQAGGRRSGTLKIRKIPAPSGVSSRADASVTRLGSGAIGRRRLGRTEEARDLIHAVAGHAAKHLLVGSRPGVAARDRRPARRRRCAAPGACRCRRRPRPRRTWSCRARPARTHSRGSGRSRPAARHHGDLPRAGFVVEAPPACGILRAAGRRSIQRRRSRRRAGRRWQGSAGLSRQATTCIRRR